MSKINNLQMKEIDNNGIIRREGYNLGKFVCKNGVYHFIDNICNGGGKYYHSTNTNCTTLEDAVAFVNK